MLPHLTHSGKRHASYPFCFLGWWSPALSSSGTVLTLPAPESVPPSPGIRGTVPITGFGVSRSVGGGGHCCLGFTWEACGKQSHTFTPVFWITDSVALGFSQSARHLQSPCWLQVRVKRSGWISKGLRSRLIPALLWISFMARFIFACVSVSNLRITKTQQIRARRRALILAPWSQFIS